MSQALRQLIIRHILAQGPMDLAQFMALALSHPEHGYYMKKDPFGKNGDFTTAPEISQMFGEMIGVWVADIWMQMGSPDPFLLLECGPGRGTLMADIMRSLRHVSGFHDACQIVFLEISPVLKNIQAKTMQSLEGLKPPLWIESLEALPDALPLVVVGNEFLDALPFHQLIRRGEGWHEVVISLSSVTTGNEENEIIFSERSARPDLEIYANGLIKESQNRWHEGDILEIAPARENFIKEVCNRITNQRGAALFIDYGHKISAAGDTFQALKDNTYVDVLSNIGDADLTSHVDFMPLRKHRAFSGFCSQGEFLKNMGILHRASALKAKSSPKQSESIDQALHRLTHPAEMGELFKVMGFRSDENIHPAGFS